MRSGLELQHRIRLDKVAENLIFVRPGFIHDFGYLEHHDCPAINPYTRPSIRAWIKAELHEILENYLFYPLRGLIQRNDGRSIKLLDTPLGFLWGLVCWFPFQDVVNYTVWCIHGCPAVQVLKKVEDKWIEF